MRRKLVVIGVVVGLPALLTTVLLARVLAFDSQQVVVEPSTRPVDAGAVAGRLSQALQIPTISTPALQDPASFEALQAWMEASYPRFHAATRREIVGEGSLLHTWEGSDPSLPPVVLMAHQDVVPVEEGTRDDWAHPPFSGAIAPCGDVPGDCVWGRGAIDMKATLVAILEAAEGLAAEGWRPRRTLLFAFGDDEEVNGSGAQAIVERLRQQGIRPAWVLDEGLVITDGIVPGAPAPVALIAVAEKGYLSLELVARSEGGHSSMPPPSTSLGRVARAVTRLEEQPFPAELEGPMGLMFDRLGPEMPFGQRLAFANRWLLEPVIVSQLEGGLSTNAAIRTTLAATMAEASPQDNVLPQEARVVVNFRIHPRDSIESVIERVKTVIDDPGIEINPVATGLYSEPSPVSSAEGEGYRAIEASIRAAVPEALVAPGLMVGATDSRFFGPIASDVYRFHPFWMTPADGERIHGTNERVRVENLVQYVRFHDAHLRRAGG